LDSRNFGELWAAKLALVNAPVKEPSLDRKRAHKSIETNQLSLFRNSEYISISCRQHAASVSRRRSLKLDLCEKKTKRVSCFKGSHRNGGQGFRRKRKPSARGHQEGEACAVMILCTGSWLASAASKSNVHGRVGTVG